MTPTFTLPKGFQYWLTVFEAPDYRIRTLARDTDGSLSRDGNGEHYHITARWDLWLHQEAQRQARKHCATKLVRRSDGQIALAVVI